MDEHGDSPVPIAVVGLACRFPGDATSPERFWDFICNARSAMSEIPKDRFNIDAFYHPSSKRQGTMNVRGGYFLKDIAAFDAPFFSITAEEAVSTDPQQRLLLEVAYEALENAGMPMSEMSGSQTSVYVGSFMKDYQHISSYDADDLPGYASTGHSSALLANRISWFFDLRGSSVTIDTGCSGSTVAFHMACESLRTGEAKIAMAGGVGAILSPDPFFSMVAFNFLSPDAKCHSFDHRANGYARGEGFSVLVLKPLSDAIRDNDNIRAVVRSSAVNQDGRTPGITLPSTEAQASLIKCAYQKAGLDLTQTQFCEAHGTGTVAGDAAELRAIAQAFAPSRRGDEPLLVGSVKTSIGHLEGCAGLAGILKAILSVESGMIPPNLWFEKPHPDNDLNAFRIKIPTTLTPWPTDGLRRASVNCFGFGGESCHVILDDADSFLSVHGLRATSAMDAGCGSAEGSPTARLFVWSSPESSGVTRLLEGQVGFLDAKLSSTTAGTASSRLARDLAYTLCNRRSVFPWRASAVARSAEELLSRLKAAPPKPLRSVDGPKVAFVFTGQGAQWHAMGRELYGFSAFRQSLQGADTYIGSIGAGWSVIEELLKRDETASKVHDSQYSQPLCTILQVALVDLLAQWGVEPCSVIGHSSGEIAAAYAAGAIGQTDAWKIAYHRGRLSSMQRCQGAMVAVNLSSKEAALQLAKVSAGEAVVGCINGPRSVTVSGDGPAVEELESLLAEARVPFKRLLVDQAYHSPHMKHIQKDYQHALEDLRPTAEPTRQVAFFSTVDGGELTEVGRLGSAEYWARNLVSPVKFFPAMQELLARSTSRPDIVVELGPHPALRGHVRQTAAMLQTADPVYVSVLERYKEAAVTALDAAGALWSRGVHLDLTKLAADSSEQPRLVRDLPPYPWNHSKSYWHEAKASKAYRFRKHPRLDLVGAPTPDSTDLDRRWRNIIRANELPWVKDHRIQGTILYPAAGMIAMVLEAARQLVDAARPATGFELHRVSISAAMVIPETGGLETILRIIPEPAPEKAEKARYRFTISSRRYEEPWRENCTGSLAVRCDKDVRAFAEWPGHRKKCAEASSLDAPSLNPSHLYEKFETAGLSYGPTFRNICRIKSDGAVSYSCVRIPDTAAVMPSRYEHPHLLHPACLDALFQNVVMTASQPMVPTSVGYVFVAADLPKGPGSTFEGFAETSRSGRRTKQGTIVMTDQEGSGPKMVLQDVGFTSLETPATESGLSRDFAEMRAKVCSEYCWKPDVDLLTGAQLQSMLGGLSAATDQLVAWIDLVGHVNPDASILNISAGGVGTTRALLEKLGHPSATTPRFSRYTWTCPDADRIGSAADALRDWKLLTEFSTFNIDAELVDQDFKHGMYDAVLVDRKIIGANCSQQRLVKIRNLLRPGGKIAFYEQDMRPKSTPAELDMGDDGHAAAAGAVRKRRGSHSEESLLCNGVKRRRSSKDLPTEDALISNIQSVGLECARLSQTEVTDVCQFVQGPVFAAVKGDQKLTKAQVLLVAPGSPEQQHSSATQALAHELLRHLRLSGVDVRLVPLEAAAQNAPGCLVVSLLEFEEPLLHNCSQDTFKRFQELTLRSDGMLWVTRGAQFETARPEAASVLGIFRSARSENSGLALHTLDINAGGDASPSEAAAIVFRTFSAIFGSKSSKAEEYEFAERGGLVYVPRIVEQGHMNEALLRKCGMASPAHQPFRKAGCIELVVGQLGSLESLHFVHTDNSDLPLHPDEVEIEVKANEVSYQDALVAMGMSSSDRLGFSVAGIVRRTGENVSRLRCGDRVVGLCRGAFRSSVRAMQQLVHKIADEVSVETAASLPADYATAKWILDVVARPSETILIHDAAAGLGLAMVQLAKQYGVEIFATARNEAERNMLASEHGVGQDRILDSRLAHLVAGLQQLTQGRGVDAVVTSLVGDDCNQLLECVADFGRFVHVENVNRTQKSPIEFAGSGQNITFSSVSLENIYLRNLPRCARALDDSLALLRLGELVPPPTSIFPCSQIGAAFSEALDSRGGSKVVVTVNDEDLVPVLPRDEHPLHLDDAACYVIVGGFGGVGQSICRYLVRHNARNLALISRSGAASEADHGFMQELQRSGAKVRAYACDVARKESLEAVLRVMAQEMPTVKGVINSAMALKDVLFEDMTHDEYLHATAPKIHGSWNLHELLPKDLDFFIMLSSVAGVAGTRGQAAYNSGNAFQVALCNHRRAQGLSAVALDLTITVGVGYVSDKDELMQALKKLGVLTISEEELHALVSSAITGRSTGDAGVAAEVMVGISTGGVLQYNAISEPMWQHDNRFAYIRKVDVVPDEASSGSALPPLRTALAGASSISEAMAIIVGRLVAKLAKSLTMPIEDMDTGKPVNAYGVDSLVAVEIRNWIFREMRASVSIFDLLSNDSILALAGKIARSSAIVPGELSRPATSTGELTVSSRGV